jgi:hypothetical protein
MHILGKVLVWLAALLAIGAVALSAKLLGVRNSWMQQLTTLKDQNEKDAETLAATRLELDSQRSELARTLIGWDRYWTDVGIDLVSPEEGLVNSNNLGTNQGLNVPARPENPTVYLFREAADGGFVFVGPFQATTIQEDNAAFKSAWQPRAGETQSWVGDSWRVRALIPPSAVDRFYDLQTKLTNDGDELLSQKQHNLEIQTQLIETAQRDLRFREEELVGAGGEDGGLVGAIAAEEEERNAALAEVDRLRRELKSRLSTQDALIKENRELSDKLPQPNRDVASQGSEVRD